MTKKKILLVIDNLGSGGAQNQLTLLAKKLAEGDFEVTLVSYFPQDFFKPRIQHNRIQHIELKKTNRLGLNIFWQLRKIIRKGNFDIMLSFLDTPNFYLSFARKIAFSKTPIVISYRSQTIFGKISRVELWIKNWMNKNATAIVANSHHEREAWTQRMPQLKSKFNTIYNAVDLEKFSPRKRLFRNNPLRILCVGSISIDKNGLIVIEALHQLIHDYNINVKLTWVGKKQNHIPSRKEYLSRMNDAIANHKLEKYWKWEPPTPNIQDLYYENDVLVHASSREGLPNVVCEALSCGMPVILSEILDHPLLVNNGKNGLLFNPSNPSELAEKILFIKNCENKVYQAFHNNAKDYAKNAFSFGQFISSFSKLFEKLTKDD